MIVRRFLLWTRVASAEQRAQAVAALAGAYLYSDLDARDRAEAETALIAVLDDVSPLVRRALAEALASAVEAPRPIIVALANDQSEIAALVLSRSPVLTPSDLVDGAAIGDAFAQTAIALRIDLHHSVAAALAEIGAPDALVALADNHSARIPAFSVRRMLERQGADPALREALLGRPDLPIDIRQGLVAEVASLLSKFVVDCRWLSQGRSERAIGEAKDRATLVLASGAPDGVARLVAHLRETSQLTPAFLLRALLSGQMALVEAAFVELTGLAPARVAGFIHERRGAGFSALYKRAALPTALAPAFAAAVAERHEAGLPFGPNLSRRIVERVISACDHLASEETASLMALLRRFEAEAAREEARANAQKLADEAALSMVVELDPEALADGAIEHETLSAAA